MTIECWTDRYTGHRIPPAPLHLRPPLTRVWKYQPTGEGLGAAKAGFGAVFTDVGAFRTTRVNLDSGAVEWTDSVEGGLIGRRRNEILAAASPGIRALSPETGSVLWSRPCDGGSSGSFVLDNWLIVVFADHFGVIDLDAGEYLWRVREFASNPLVADHTILIRADEDVSCYDLETGAVRWRRPGSDFGGKAQQMGFLWRDLFCVRIGEPLLLTALEAKTGKTVWRSRFSVSWCEPYGDRAYGIEPEGVYRAIDLATGHAVFEKQVSNPPLPTGRKGGLMVAASESWPWREAVLSVSETHTFIQRPAGQIVVLDRESGEVEQVVELDGMPASKSIIYENNLLLTDFNAAVYCFRGAE